MRTRLTARIAGAVAVVGVIFLASIVVLAFAIADLRDSSAAATESEQTLQAAQQIGALVVDAETGTRGFAITGQNAFLEPLDAASRNLPKATRDLLSRPATSRSQRVLAVSIADAARMYLEDYAQPLVVTLRKDLAAGRAIIRTAAGKRRTDAIRGDIEQLTSAVRQQGADRIQVTESHAEQALLIALSAGIVAVLLFIGLIVCLSRWIAAPIRRAATAAEKIGSGQFGVRLNEPRTDEIGQLSDAFNAMGTALQHSTAELESQHAELETQNGELERQAVEMESQTVELEAQAAELEAGQMELAETNEALAAQAETLEAASEALLVANARVSQFARVAEALGRHTELTQRADTLLAAITDLADAPVGALYARPSHRREAVCVVSRHGLTAETLPDDALDRESVARRAIDSGCTVIVAHPEGDLRLRTLGADLVLRHELHTPLLHAGETLGVASIGRSDDRPFGADEIQAIEHLAEQGAVAIANSLEAERSRWLADLNGAVLDSTGDGIRLVDLEGRLILENPEMERFLREVLCEGHDVSELTPVEVSAIIAQRTVDPEAYRARITAVVSDPDLEAVDEYQLVDTGRWIRRYSAPVNTRDGERIGRIFVLSETTETHDAERMKDELMATVSHELRTPLSAILGFTELLMARDYGAEERKEYLATVHQQASRLSDLISDFLDLQRLEHSEEPIAMKPVDLREILASQVKLFSAQSQRHALELKAAQDLEIHGDADRLRRALANLLSNAIKYSPSGGQVTVDAVRSNGDVTISVTDHGLGIPTDVQHRIFDRFFRVDSSETSHIGGTGLGLSLVREIVRAHHGEVGVDSVEGQGSRFWMKVPAG